MSDDLVSRLRQDAEMFQDGPQRNLTKLWHSEVVKDAAKDCQEAATALTEARAEIERLRTVLTDPAAFHLHALRNGVLSRMNALHLAGATDYDALKSRALAAESELATLRARVREVVGPFAEIAGSEAFQFQTREWNDLVIAKPTGVRLAFIQTGSFRAARQLMEEVK